MPRISPLASRFARHQLYTVFGRYPVADALRLLRAHRLILLHQSYSLHYISVPSETLQVMRDAKTRRRCTNRRANTGREDTKARRRTWKARSGMCVACLSRWSWANYSAYAEAMKRKRPPRGVWPFHAPSGQLTENLEKLHDTLRMWTDSGDNAQQGIESPLNFPSYFQSVNV